MKIGILTQPLNNNYGGLLQNFALQTVLKRLNHDVITLDWTLPKCMNFRGYTILCLRFVLYYLSFGNVRKIKRKYLLRNNEDEVIHKHVNYFAYKYITKTKKTDNLKSFYKKALSEDCNAYIVGSDQCWRPCYNGQFLLAMYLSFVKRSTTKKMSYAASFGTDEWEYNKQLTTKCAELAGLFDLITVRESSGVKLCNKFLKVHAEQVLDPTMLLDKEDYVRLIEIENEQKSQGSLFYYILDPNEQKSNFINNASLHLGLTPFMVLPKYKEEYRTKEHVKNHLEDCVYPSVTSWLRAFVDAKMTIVDSFHGMVFSIIFNKPFWVIGNKSRGITRFLSLLQQLDLQDRLLYADKLHDVDLNKPINWNLVNNKREDLKQKSISLLYNFLNNE